MIVGGHVGVKQAASASQMGRFESELLAASDNTVVLANLLGPWIDRIHNLKPPNDVVLDMDSSVSPTFGVRKARPTTATSAAPVITCCSCSTIWATWSGPVCVPAMSEVLTAGEMSWSRWSHAKRNRRFGSTFPVTRHLPRWTSTNSWKPREFTTRSACLPTRVSKRTLPTGSVVQSIVRQSVSSGSMLVLPISRIVGQEMPGGGQGQMASRRPISGAGFIVTKVSRPAGRVVPFYSQGARRSNGSKKGRTPSDGPGRDATGSATTRSGSSFRPSRTIPPTFCEPWRCPRRLSTSP